MIYCRSSFSTILEIPGLLSKLILDNFYPSFDLYNDLVLNNKLIEFEDYIYNLSGISVSDSLIDSSLTPKEIFDKLGYDFYECRTEDDINYFKRYYAKGEELCTFLSNRLSRCYVFWVVRRDALKLNREEYTKPSREDEYGTSVMSIQFDKSKYNRLSIKNRYNDTINNPDATYGNNLDNIYPGLTRSFYSTYGLITRSSLESNFYMNGYVYGSDKRFYKYNYCYNGIYYCTDNIIIDNDSVLKYPKEKYIIFDYFVLDLVNKKLFCYDSSINDSLSSVIGNIKYINIFNDNTNMCKYVNIINDSNDKFVITLSRDNKLIKFENDSCKELPDRFLIMNRYLKELCLYNLNSIGNDVLYSNTDLEYLKCDNVLFIGDDFLRSNVNLSFIVLPYCNSIGSYFLSSNRILSSIFIPNVLKIGKNFLFSNIFLNSIECNRLEYLDSNFLYNNDSISCIRFDSLVSVGNYFMFNNKRIDDISFDSLEVIGNNFLMNNLYISSVNLPCVKYIGKYFMSMNENINYIKIPNVEYIGNYFLYKNRNRIDVICNSNVRYENKVNKIFIDNISKGRTK